MNILVDTHILLRPPGRSRDVSVGERGAKILAAALTPTLKV
ncbi:MAG: hypothetical protein WBB57_02530 [Mycobacterium sp.]